MDGIQLTRLQMTHLGDLPANQHSHKRETLVIKASMRKSTVSPLMINLSSHNHGEESRKHTQLRVSLTQNSLGQINQQHSPKKIRRTSVTKESMRKFMVLLPTINQSSHSHGEELRKLTQLRVSLTQNSLGLINQPLLHKSKTLETQNT